MDILTIDQVRSNYNEFRDIINTQFTGERTARLNKLYDDYSVRLKTAPASSYDYFHNAFPGGYCDHILRVVKFAKATYKLWKMAGMYLDNFTEEELIFSALNHDLGKLGLPGDNLDKYILNKSDWHVKNQGKLYENNGNLPHVTISDTTMYILHRYGIDMSLNEYLTIKIHDGVYDDANKSYYTGFNIDSKMKSTLPIIMHHADMMASRFEFERWAQATGKFNLSSLPEWENLRKIKNTIDNPITKETTPLNFDNL